MSNPTGQHYVPVCYLKQFVDPQLKDSVWIISKDGKNKRHQKPSKILKVRDLYTVEVNGTKHYNIEETISNFEHKYAKIFDEKIKHKKPLSEYEHVILCAFTSIMLQRTLRHKDNYEAFLDKLIEMSENMEKAHNVPAKKSLELKKHRQNAHKQGILESLPDISALLFQMNLAFLCVGKSASRFITSDDPCNLFNPKLQWQKFYGPGLGQKDIEVTMALSPEIKLCFSWGEFSGYMTLPNWYIEDSNRMTRARSYKEFIASSPKTKRLWFSKYPLDPIFLLQIFMHKVRLFISRH